ncbi:hypothetical protein C0Q70_05458 [Pomacea canaliculata]|nr:hypothetical protein C0Q70_05458 [Pomacea canaliculata]
MEEDDLLYFSQHHAVAGEVTSSKHVLRVELMTVTPPGASPPDDVIFPQNDTYPIHLHGFIASYHIRERHPSGLPAPLYRRVQSSVLQSDVTVVGIVVCAVLLAVLLGVAVVQRLYWRHLPKYNMAATEESPAHCAHSSSAHSSQPSSPGPHVQVDMDIPLTGGGRRKSSSGQKAVSRASSVSSTCSATLKKLRARADGAESSAASKGAGAVCNGSPKPSTRAYTPVENTSPQDTDLDPSFFRSSPIFRHVAPRSPRVHPHGSSASVDAPVSPMASPVLTKHDLLARKRQKREGSVSGGGELDREVTGSSGSYSVSKKLTPTLPTPTTTSISIRPRPTVSQTPTSGNGNMRSPFDPRQKPVTTPSSLHHPLPLSLQTSGNTVRSPTSLNHSFVPTRFSPSDEKRSQQTANSSSLESKNSPTKKKHLPTGEHSTVAPKICQQIKSTVLKKEPLDRSAFL